MLILEKMYTGRYISQWGNLGHEAINLIPADDGKFYIWLNANGTVPENRKADVRNCTVLMLHGIDSKHYKVIGKAEECEPCEAASISHTWTKRGEEERNKKERYESQKKLGVTYNRKCPMDDIYDEKDIFATFTAKRVWEVKKAIYITTEESDEDEENGIYYADFQFGQQLRKYIDDDSSFRKILDGENWKEIPHDIKSIPAEVREPSFNFFKLLGKEKDELAFSNALSYFIRKSGIDRFLKEGLPWEKEFPNDDYKIEREKHNMDISFWGKNNVVILENKIDANITDGTKSKESQIRNAVRSYCDEGKQGEIADAINSVIDGSSGEPSQLSKYYIYAVAYLLKQGVEQDEIKNRIHCFLLTPEYAKNMFKTKDKKYLIGEKYRGITYQSICEYFDKVSHEDKNPLADEPYYEGFRSALEPLQKEVNNELEEEMKYLFYNKIGLIEN